MCRLGADLPDVESEDPMSVIQHPSVAIRQKVDAQACRDLHNRFMRLRAAKDSMVEALWVGLLTQHFSDEDLVRIQAMVPVGVRLQLHRSGRIPAWTDDAVDNFLNPKRSRRR